MDETESINCFAIRCATESYGFKEITRQPVGAWCLEIASLPTVYSHPSRVADKSADNLAFAICLLAFILHEFKVDWLAIALSRYLDKPLWPSVIAGKDLDQGTMLAMEQLSMQYHGGIEGVIIMMRAFEQTVSLDEEGRIHLWMKNEIHRTICVLMKSPPMVKQWYVALVTHIKGWDQDVTQGNNS